MLAISSPRAVSSRHSPTSANSVTDALQCGLGLGGCHHGTRPGQSAAAHDATAIRPNSSRGDRTDSAPTRRTDRTGRVSCVGTHTQRLRAGKPVELMEGLLSVMNRLSSTRSPVRRRSAHACARPRPDRDRGGRRPISRSCRRRRTSNLPTDFRAPLRDRDLLQFSCPAIRFHVSRFNEPRSGEWTRRGPPLPGASASCPVTRMREAPASSSWGFSFGGRGPAPPARAFFTARQAFDPDGTRRPAVRRQEGSRGTGPFRGLPHRFRRLDAAHGLQDPSLRLRRCRNRVRSRPARRRWRTRPRARRRGSPHAGEHRIPSVPENDLAVPPRHPSSMGHPDLRLQGGADSVPRFRFARRSIGQRSSRLETAPRRPETMPIGRRQRPRSGA